MVRRSARTISSAARDAASPYPSIQRRLTTPSSISGAASSHTTPHTSLSPPLAGSSTATPSPALSAQWSAEPGPRHYSATRVIKMFNEYCHYMEKPVPFTHAPSDYSCSSWDEAIARDKPPWGTFLIKPFLYFYGVGAESTAHPSGKISKATFEKFAFDLMEVYNEARELAGVDGLDEEMRMAVIEGVRDVEERLGLPGKSCSKMIASRVKQEEHGAEAGGEEVEPIPFWASIRWD